ncbi:helix-turn-helix transcriptional regulator [uncultured Dysosmobacter sp.]|uniref:helix-turn-helix domain-containing protein n=1 Tax=uncultured Dysosmobacter sp. TaxID=2591384 RepID=UPI0026241697|nr:helix-turn-helix transcriptional regulator [uncultured Dysosmobacter sp.]
MRINRERFAAALVRLDLNGNKLAEKAGVSRGTVTAVRTGKSCSRETADKLAAVLGQDIIEKGD